MDGKVEFAKVFDTYKTSVEFDHFLDREIPDGQIVVVACKDDCIQAMSDKGKNWFEKMGSKAITTLKYR